MSEIDTVRCAICDTVGNWQNVDEFRFKPSGMCMCRTCGFINYPKLVANAKSVKDFYVHDYRAAPTVHNIWSGERKIHYHAEFLLPLLKEWKEAGKKNPRVFEIGAAFGMALRWFQEAYPGVDVSGTELTTSFVRNAWHLYNIRLDAEPDYSKKYDLLMSYRVHEHIPNPDIELRKHIELIDDGGYLYISVPTWFDELNNHGTHGLDLEFYYDPNHINVWTHNLFRQFLKKVGLKIVRENNTFYNATMLCQRDDSVMSEPRVWDDPKVRLDELSRVFNAAKALLEHRFQEAINFWPNFPDAHINNYEINRNKAHQGGFKEIMEKYLVPAIEACPTSSVVRNFAADVCMRYEQYTEAVNFLKQSLEIKPNEAQALMALGQCFRQMAERAQNEKDKFKLIREARQATSFLGKTSQQSSFDAQTWIMQDNAKLPAPFETA